jgi:hypothetical protein
LLGEPGVRCTRLGIEILGLFVIVPVILVVMDIARLKNNKRSLRPKSMLLLSLLYFLCFLVTASDIKELTQGFLFASFAYAPFYLVAFWAVSIVLFFTHPKQVAPILNPYEKDT